MSVNYENAQIAVDTPSYPGVSALNFGSKPNTFKTNVQIRDEYELSSFDTPPQATGHWGGFGLSNFNPVNNWRNFISQQLWTEITKSSIDIHEDNYCLFKAPKYDIETGFYPFTKEHPEFSNWIHLNIGSMDVLVPPDSYSHITIKPSDVNRVTFTFEWKITRMLVWYMGAFTGMDYQIHEDVFPA